MFQAARRDSCPPKSHMIKWTFFHTTSSTLEPIVGEVCTTSFMRNWYKMVVLPALSRPTMHILCSAKKEEDKGMMIEMWQQHDHNCTSSLMWPLPHFGIILHMAAAGWACCCSQFYSLILEFDIFLLSTSHFHTLEYYTAYSAYFHARS